MGKAKKLKALMNKQRKLDKKIAVEVEYNKNVIKDYIETLNDDDKAHLSFIDKPVEIDKKLSYKSKSDDIFAFKTEPVKMVFNSS